MPAAKNWVSKVLARTSYYVCPNHLFSERAMVQGEVNKNKLLKVNKNKLLKVV